MIFLILIIVFSKNINSIFLNNISFTNYFRSHRQQSIVFRGSANIWPEKEIPYFVSPMLDYALINAALYRITKETCLMFRYKKNIKESLFIYLPGKYYETNLGRRKEIPHKIYISINFKDIGKVMRETMRALGIGYEHNRHDRNNYIMVFKNNIKPHFLKYFSKKQEMFINTYDITYDFRSIRHFSSHEYAKSSKNTIIPKEHSMELVMGTSGYLTFNDAKFLNINYCSYPHISHPKCLYYGYQDPRVPTRCKCLPFLTGNQCDLIITNDNYCTQDNLFYASKTPSNITLSVGGRCFFMIQTGLGNRIKMFMKFLNIRRYTTKKCTENNSIEIKTRKDLSTSGILFCPNKYDLRLTTPNDIVAIVSNFPQSNILLNIQFVEHRV
ncbi:Astacin-like metalloendopeptidase [Strongyloides ratti]|uniref:Metalloendopeptidase n=1 Tax=Strongyloides ratti TaxID=34506 RepID=A0A090LKV5_STRRB|nr:Astacin-like metalloendopeptidase [Strongyloides ratti]CEF70338.1 Astacin-like metalloendopeptidase [Strongyloides ratti]